MEGGEGPSVEYEQVLEQPSSEWLDYRSSHTIQELDKNRKKIQKTPQRVCTLYEYMYTPLQLVITLKPIYSEHTPL